MTKTDNFKQELSKLDHEIKRAQFGAIILMVLVLLSYFLWFKFKVNAQISHLSGDWGTLGDFFGGLLNPVIGLFAVYWLTKSVRLQKEELYETRSTLEKSAESQKIQVNLSALTALINSIMAEVEILRNNSIFLCDQLKTHEYGLVMDIQGNKYSIQDARNEIADINQRISDRLFERLEYENKIKEILKEYTHN